MSTAACCLGDRYLARSVYSMELENIQASSLLIA